MASPAPTVADVLASPFPNQSAVYVVYESRQRAHVIPVNTSAKHSVVRQLREDGAEGGAIAAEVARHPEIYDKLDEAGFFNGVSGDEVVARFFTPDVKRAIRESWVGRVTRFPEIYFGAPRLTEGLAVPYDRYPVQPPSAVSATLPERGEETVRLGHITVSGQQLDSFGVSMRQQMHHMLPIFKIDSLAIVDEQELSSDEYISETPISTSLEDATLAAISGCAIEIIKNAISHPDSQVDRKYAKLVSHPDTRVVVHPTV